jgi:hypothetical protein
MGGVSSAGALLLTHPATAAAQCIMCYLSAGSSGERGAQVLRLGILALAIPTLLIFAGLFFLAYRHRKPVERIEDEHASGQLAMEPHPPFPTDRQSHSPSFY